LGRSNGEDGRQNDDPSRYGSVSSDLLPGISHMQFTVAERFDCLKASMSKFGHETGIAVTVSHGHWKSCAQVKNVVNRLQTKFPHFHFKLPHLNPVDCLPECFFGRTSNLEQIKLIRCESLLNRIAAPRQQLSMETPTDLD
jgi:hypothetical protein